VELTTAKAELNEIMQQLQTERTDKAQTDQRAAKLRMELQGMRTAAERAKSTNKVANILMSESAAGRIPGVYGRLGDLAAIDAAYDCAISSACGYLDHILVDSVRFSPLNIIWFFISSFPSGANWCQVHGVSSLQQPRQS
jgi:structural maintenance of chromosome 4